MERKSKGNPERRETLSIHREREGRGCSNCQWEGSFEGLAVDSGRWVERGEGREILRKLPSQSSFKTFSRSLSFLSAARVELVSLP